MNVKADPLARFLFFAAQVARGAEMDTKHLDPKSKPNAATYFTLRGQLRDAYAALWDSLSEAQQKTLMDKAFFRDSK